MKNTRQRALIVEDTTILTCNGFLNFAPKELLTKISTRMDPRPPTLQADSLSTEPPGKPLHPHNPMAPLNLHNNPWSRLLLGNEVVTIAMSLTKD